MKINDIMNLLLLVLMGFMSFLSMFRACMNF